MQTLSAAWLTVRWVEFGCALELPLSHLTQLNTLLSVIYCSLISINTKKKHTMSGDLFKCSYQGAGSNRKLYCS